MADALFLNNAASYASGTIRLGSDLGPLRDVAFPFAAEAWRKAQADDLILSGNGDAILQQLAQAQDGTSRLGDLSMRYETGHSPGQEAEAAGVVSSGAGDPGGVSYGAYQFASSKQGGEQVQAFLTSPEGAPWADRFKGMDPAQSGGAFEQEWKKIAAGGPDTFFQAQHNYTKRTHGDPTVQKVQDATGLDVSQRSKTVQDVVWSMSVQHGRAPALVARAVEQAGPQGNLPDIDYDRKLINQLYAVRNAYVDQIGQPGLKTRYLAEQSDALRELEGRTS